MQTQKEKLSNNINAFPNEKKAFFDWSNLDYFPVFLENSFQMLEELYDKQTLAEMAKEDQLNFIFLINKMLDAFQVLDNWIKTNESLLFSASIHEASQSLLKKQAEQLDEVVKKLKEFKSKTADVQKNITRLEQENQQLGKKEAIFKELVNNKQKLAARKEELLMLKKDVRENKLQDLANQVQQLEQQLKEKEQEKIDLLDKKNTIAIQVNDLKTGTQKILSETVLLGKANEILEDIKKKCVQHNEEVVDVLVDDTEQLKLQLDFSISTSTELIDSSIEDLIDKTKNNLKSIDKAILEKIA